MHPFYELAYALASGSLAFFVGTGFSKHLTNNSAPNWQTLLEKCCDKLNDPEKLKQELFPPGQKPTMPLEECASIIHLQMLSEDKDIYTAIAKELIDIKISPQEVEYLSKFSVKHSKIKYITTNYDRIIEDHILKGNYTGYCPGFPINRQITGAEVYHLHGSISMPSEMIVTADDYFKFINQSGYYSSKLSTLLEENTILIMGYSLGDLNLKSILNKHRSRSGHAINRQHLFFLSRSVIPQHIKDYYDISYGLRVIDPMEINILLSMVDSKFEKIKDDVATSRDDLKKALRGETKYTDEFLKKKDSFSEILATISSTGFRVEHRNIQEFIKETLHRKHAFTSITNAWEQYTHLADWLIQIGSIMDIKEPQLKETYLSSVKTSFETMSKTKEFGKSWDAYKAWRDGWTRLTFHNRILIKSFVNTQGITGDCQNFIA